VPRGGSFIYPPASVRAANRGWGAPSNHGFDYGFRPARTYY